MRSERQHRIAAGRQRSSPRIQRVGHGRQGGFRVEIEDEHHQAHDTASPAECRDSRERVVAAEDDLSISRRPTRCTGTRRARPAESDEECTRTARNSSPRRRTHDRGSHQQRRPSPDGHVEHRAHHDAEQANHLRKQRRPRVRPLNVWPKRRTRARRTPRSCSTASGAGATENTPVNRSIALHCQ